MWRVNATETTTIRWHAIHTKGDTLILINYEGSRLVAKSLTNLASRHVLGMRVDATSYEDASRRVLRWAHRGQSAYVCVATVHMTMEAYNSTAFRQVVNEADLVTPDGRPLGWALKSMGVKSSSQVRGTDLTTHVLEQAAHENVAIGLYGGTPELMEAFVRILKTRYPKLRVVCQIAPPFRSLTPEGDEAVTDKIVASGVRILFVGIGCPKQEKSMAAHEGRIPAVMLGVGAAFDFHTGRVPQAPRWMQVAGLEWVFQVTNGSSAIVEALCQTQSEVCRTVSNASHRSMLRSLRGQPRPREGAGQLPAFLLDLG